MKKKSDKVKSKPKTIKLTDPESGGTLRTTAMQGMMKEWTQSALAMLGGLSDYNPDDLVLSKGTGVKIYQDMIRDPYVKAAISLKKISVSRLPMRILPASEDEKDQEIAKFVEMNLEKMETTIDTLLWGVMNCVDVGYSIGEMNYRIVETGDFKGKIAMKSVKSKDPYVFVFRIDEYGNIAAIVQRIGGFISEAGAQYKAGSLNMGQNEFPPDKFLIASFQPLYANPYGQSDLRSAYRAFFIKDWAWKFRAIFMEKWGMPPIIGTFPNGTTEQRRQKLEEVLESIQNETVITIPEDLKVEILRIASEGRTTEYERAIADLNKEILIGIMGSFLWAEEGKRTGARAQGQVHFQVSKLFVEHLATIIEDVLNRQLVKRIVDMNYKVEEYPKIKFETSRAEELSAEMSLDKDLKEMGVTLDPSYFYKKYGRPMPSQADAIQTVGPEIEGAPIPDQPIDDSAPAPEGPPAPDQPPSSPVPAEGTFDKLRQSSIPEDPQKIGQMREMYSWVLRMREVSVSTAPDFSKIESTAFALAGLERDFHKQNGRWMNHAEAWRIFNKSK